MTEPTPYNTLASCTDELLTALRAGERDRAGRALAAVEPPPGAEQLSAFLRPLAEGLMRRRRWADAEWAFSQIPDLGRADPAAAMKRRLARNLAALETHRPAVYRQLVNLPPDDSFVVASAPTGLPTVAARRADGSLLSLSPGHDPLAAVARATHELKPVLDAGQALALCGAGDGYLLAALARDRRALFLGMEQPVLLIEPQPRALLACLMIHDYAGAGGPIEQPRFRWFVGPGWAKELEADLAADPFAGFPGATVGQSIDAAAVTAELQTVLAAVAGQDRRAKADVEAYYAATDQREQAALFGPNPPRRPRVLLLTTRFSTVLQYATRDAAAGFERAGWEPRVLIEPSPAHRLYRHGIRRALAEFKPDLVFQLDHLRHEHEDLFPPNLPFACWVQDHLPNLMNGRAGRSVGPTDFVLTDAASTYVGSYGYPKGQCIALSKLTTPPPTEAVIRPLHPPGQDDLIFVSNASRPPQTILDELLAAIPSPADRDLAAECGRRLIESYAGGGSLATYPEVVALVREAATDLNARPTEDGAHALARRLTHPLNDALYRQQALRWAADAADRLGLTLALYGKGWEQHPDFARYARGPVEYGDALRDLTRRSAINLQVVPYLCLHQRLLDGIAAGGFFLVRRHPADVAPQAMLDLLEEYVGPGVGSLGQTRAKVPPPARDRFESLLRECRRCLCSTGTEDPIEMIRAWQEAELLVAGEGVLPHSGDVSFADAESLRRLVGRFARDAAAREAVVRAQWLSVERRLTYAAGMGRVARQIGEKLLKSVPAPQPVVRAA